MDPRLEQLGRDTAAMDAATKNSSPGTASPGRGGETLAGAFAPVESADRHGGAKEKVDTSHRTEQLSMLRANRDREIKQIRDNHELTPQARAEREREARSKWDAAISAEAKSIMRKLDEENAALEREMYRTSKPADQATELFLERLRKEVTDELVAGQDPVVMYQDAIRFGDKQKACILERVAPPWLEEAEQRKRFEALVADNEPGFVKEAREKRTRLRDERRDLELGLSMAGL